MLPLETKSHEKNVKKYFDYLINNWPGFKVKYLWRLKSVYRKIYNIIGTKIAYDIDSGRNISDGGKHIAIPDIFDLFKRSGALIYRGSQGNKPIIISRGIFSRPVKIIEFDKLSKEQQNKIINHATETKKR